MSSRASFLFGSLGLATLAGCASSAHDPSTSSPPGAEGPGARATAAKIDSVPAPTTLGPELPDETGAHLAFSLRDPRRGRPRPAPAPTSKTRSRPSYHAWVTPRTVRRSLRPLRRDVRRIVAWLGAEGLRRHPLPEPALPRGARHRVRACETSSACSRAAATRGARTFRSYAEPLVAPGRHRAARREGRRARHPAPSPPPARRHLPGADIAGARRRPTSGSYDMSDDHETGASGLTPGRPRDAGGDDQTSEERQPGPPRSSRRRPPPSRPTSRSRTRRRPTTPSCCRTPNDDFDSAAPTGSTSSTSRCRAWARRTPRTSTWSSRRRARSS